MRPDQMTHENLEDISDEEWAYTLRLNIGAYFYLVKAALPHMPEGSSIIGSSSVNSDMPSPALAPYAATKAAIANFSASLAQLLGGKGIRVNSVAPGPIWTPLIPSTMPSEKVQSFGENTPLGRAGQPVELAPVYVLLASDEASYISGARVAVTGGRPSCDGRSPVPRWLEQRQRRFSVVLPGYQLTRDFLVAERKSRTALGCKRA
jgi:NAD(P)-dependent dehydrogenase (short-subunit alcohol dehydrogenase family)